MLDNLRGLSISHYISNLMHFLSFKCVRRQVRDELLKCCRRKITPLPGLKVEYNLQKLNFGLIEIWLQFEAL